MRVWPRNPDSHEQAWLPRLFPSARLLGPGVVHCYEAYLGFVLILCPQHCSRRGGNVSAAHSPITVDRRFQPVVHLSLFIYPVGGKGASFRGACLPGSC